MDMNDEESVGAEAGAAADRAVEPDTAVSDIEVTAESDAVDPTVPDAPPLRRVLEALLLVVDQATGEAPLAAAAGVTPDEVARELERWREDLAGSGSGMDLRRSAEGWRLYTRRTMAPYVERFLTEGSRATLTRAALETLAVVAYRQPVTRARVAAVRGVNVDGVIRSLGARGLVVECGNDPDTGGLLYRTTELFLERLGLESIEELPDIAPLLPDVDLVEELSDDPADDPRVPVGRRGRRAASESDVPNTGDPTDHDDPLDTEEM